MDKIRTYEEYTQVLADFKSGRARCGTNTLMTREELTALIEAGKLWYEQIGDTLWFFTNEGYFYTGVYYVPADKAIEMRVQDMDVVVELMGKGDRYDVRRDAELVAAGFDKRDKRLEHIFDLATDIEQVRRQNETLTTFWGRKGFTCRTATKADYPELRKLWLDRIGADRYSVTEMTEAELDEMERFGRCVVVCDKEGRIQSAEIYKERNGTCLFHLFASYMLGMGGWIDQKTKLQAHDEGCNIGRSWIRVDNVESRSLGSGTGATLSGKYLWLFVYLAENSKK